MGADARGEVAGEHPARTPAPSGPNRSGTLSTPGGEDDRAGEQEGEPGGVPVGQAAQQQGQVSGPAAATRAGTGTLCPRLETGNNSDTPCVAPMTIASARLG
jgi:hypothetical protein